MPIECNTCNTRLTVLIKAHDGGRDKGHVPEQPCARCDNLLNLMGRQHNGNSRGEHAIAVSSGRDQT